MFTFKLVGLCKIVDLFSLFFLLGGGVGGIWNCFFGIAFARVSITFFLSGCRWCNRRLCSLKRKY